MCFEMQCEGEKSLTEFNFKESFPIAPVASSCGGLGKFKISIFALKEKNTVFCVSNNCPTPLQD